jgi:hypothetical protein
VSSRARSVPRTRAPPAPQPPGAAIVTSAERPKCAYARLGPSCAGSSCRGPQVCRMIPVEIRGKTPVRTFRLRPREQRRQQPPRPLTFRTQSQTGAGRTSAAGERHFLFQGLACAWRAASAPAVVNGTGRCVCVCVYVLCVTQCPIVCCVLCVCNSVFNCLAGLACMCAWTCVCTCVRARATVLSSAYMHTRALCRQP